MMSAQHSARDSTAPADSRSSASDRVRIDQTLHFVAERSWQVGDDRFFQDLVVHLGRALGVGYAFCATVQADRPDQVVTLALYAHGEVAENIEYGLAGTPCENVVGQHLCCHTDQIQQQFPDDPLLPRLSARSYVGIPLWAADGTALGLIAVVDDKPLQAPELTKTLLQIVAVRAGAELERTRVLERLRESQRRFADFAQVSSDWFWETDAALRFSYFSDRFEAVTGVPPGQLLGRTREQVGAPGADPDAYRALLDHLRNRRAFRDFQHRRVKADGTTVYLSISGKPAYDERGCFLGFRGIGRDITAQKTAEHELRLSRDQAQRANTAKTEFLANMSHELRTPLNAIIGFADVMAHQLVGPLDPRYTAYAADIRTSGDHLLALINDILDISRVEAGKVTLQPEPVDLRGTVEACCSLLQHTAAANRVALANELPARLPRLLGDPRRIRQILLNLMGNALKFSPAGTTVRVRAQATADGLAVEVVDQGVGIAPGELEAVFEPFRQLDGGLQRTHDGAGLGLALVKRFVELHGGTIQLASAPGEGTTAVLRFPPERLANEGADAAADRPRPGPPAR